MANGDDNNYISDEQREKYLQSLGQSMETKDEINEEISNLKKYDDYMRDRMSNTRAFRPYDIDQSAQEIDPMLSEYNRLGIDYRVGMDTGQDDLWRKQSAWEKFTNAGYRAFANTYYDTIGGLASMFDFEDYYNANDEVGNEISRWAEEQKKKTAEAAPIYQRENAGMGDFAWWMENGSSLVGSIAAFGIQGALLGGGMGLIGKGVKAVKGLSALQKASKSKAVMRGIDDALQAGKRTKDVGANWWDKLNSAATMDASKALGQGATRVAHAAAMNQAESIMSASQVYDETYKKAIQQGYSEDYAKRLAATAGSNVVNLNRMNIALNLTSANKFLKGTNDVSSLVKKRNWKNQLLDIGQEGFQESTEEGINLLAEKQSTLLASELLGRPIEEERAARTGTPADLPKVPGTVKAGGISMADTYRGIDITNPFGDATTKEIFETMALGALGGIGQTGMIKAVDAKVKLAPTVMGKTFNLIGGTMDARYTQNQYYADGSLKARKGDLIYETEDATYDQDIVDEATGEVKHKKGDVVYKESANGTKEAVQVAKTDKTGKPKVMKVGEVDETTGVKTGGKATKFTRNQLHNKRVERLENDLKPLLDQAGKFSKLMGGAKYQNHVESTIASIEDFINKGRGGMDKEASDLMYEGLATLELLHEGKTELTPEMVKKKQEELMAEEMSEKQLREKQNDLLEMSLAQQAVQSFELGYKNQLKRSFGIVANMTPEEAAEKGYGADYREKALEAIDKVNSYYKRWREYNGKHSPEIARALFFNRIKRDKVNDEMKDLNDEMKKLHDAEFKKFAAKEGLNENDFELKEKYDKVFKLEKERQLKIQRDKKLKDLKKQKAKLEKEITNLIQEGQSGKVTPDDFRVKVEELGLAIEANDKAIEDRQAEISKPIQEQINALDLPGANGPATVWKQAAMNQERLNRVSSAIELDNEFDLLRSKKGQEELDRRDRQKRLDRLKNQMFITHMNDILRLQSEGGGAIYAFGQDIHQDPMFGNVTLVRKGDKFFFEIQPEEPFLIANTDEAKAKYKDVVRPDLREEYEKKMNAYTEALNEYRKDKKEADKELSKLENEVIKLEKEIATAEKNSKGDVSEKVQDEFKEKVKTLKSELAKVNKEIKNIKNPLDARAAKLNTTREKLEKDKEEKYDYFKFYPTENENFVIVQPAGYRKPTAYKTGLGVQPAIYTRKVFADGTVGPFARLGESSVESGEKVYVIDESDGNTIRDPETGELNDSAITMTVTIPYNGKTDKKIMLSSDQPISFEVDFDTLSRVSSLNATEMKVFKAETTARRLLNNRITRIRYQQKLYNDKVGELNEEDEVLEQEKKKLNEELEKYLNAKTALETGGDINNLDLPEVAELKMLKLKMQDAMMSSIKGQIAEQKSIINDIETRTNDIKQKIDAADKYIAKQEEMINDIILGKITFNKDRRYEEARRVRTRIQNTINRKEELEHQLERLNESVDLKKAKERLEQLKTTFEAFKNSDYDSDLFKMLADVNTLEKKKVQLRLMADRNQLQLEALEELHAFYYTMFGKGKRFSGQHKKSLMFFNNISKSINQSIKEKEFQIKQLANRDAELYSSQIQDLKDEITKLKIFRDTELDNIKDPVNNTSVDAALRSLLNDNVISNEQYKDLQSNWYKYTAQTTLLESMLLKNEDVGSDFIDAAEVLGETIYALQEESEAINKQINELNLRQESMSRVWNSSIAAINPEISAKIFEDLAMQGMDIQDYFDTQESSLTAIGEQQSKLKDSEYDLLERMVSLQDRNRKLIYDKTMIKELIEDAQAAREVLNQEGLSEDELEDLNSIIGELSPKGVQEMLDLLDAEIIETNKRLNNAAILANAPLDAIVGGSFADGLDSAAIAAMAASGSGVSIGDSVEDVKEFSERVKELARTRISLDFQRRKLQLLYEGAPSDAFDEIIEAEAKVMEKIKNEIKDYTESQKNAPKDVDTVEENAQSKEVYKEMEKFENRKATPYTTAGKQLAYDKTKKERKFITVGGVQAPVFTKNPSDLRWFQFLNELVGRKGENDLKENYALQIVKVSDVEDDPDVVLYDAEGNQLDDSLIKEGDLLMFLVDKATGDRVMFKDKPLYITFANKNTVANLSNAAVFSAITKGTIVGGEYDGKTFEEVGIRYRNQARKEKITKFKINGKEYSLNFNEKSKEYQELRSLAIQFYQDEMKEFREEVNNLLETQQVFVAIDNVSEGDLLRTQDTDSGKDLHSKFVEEFINSDLFEAFRFTSAGGGTMGRIDSSNKSVKPGLPYIQLVDGTLIETYPRKVDDNDIETLIHLISNWAKSGAKGKLKDGNNEAFYFNQAGKKNIPGLINRIINWNRAGSVAKSLNMGYEIKESVKRLYYVPPGEGASKKYVDINILHKVAEGKALTKRETTILNNFKNFLKKNKVKNVNKNLLQQTAKKAVSYDSYVHPYVENGKLKLREYKSSEGRSAYTNYLIDNNVLETNVLPPSITTELTKDLEIDQKNPRVGRYVTFANVPAALPSEVTNTKKQRTSIEETTVESETTTELTDNEDNETLDLIEIDRRVFSLNNQMTFAKENDLSPEDNPNLKYIFINDIIMTEDGQISRASFLSTKTDDAKFINQVDGFFSFWKNGELITDENEAKELEKLFKKSNKEVIDKYIDGLRDGSTSKQLSTKEKIRTVSKKTGDALPSMLEKSITANEKAGNTAFANELKTQLSLLQDFESAFPSVELLKDNGALFFNGFQLTSYIRPDGITSSKQTLSQFKQLDVVQESPYFNLIDLFDKAEDIKIKFGFINSIGKIDKNDNIMLSINLVKDSKNTGKAAVHEITHVFTRKAVEDKNNPNVQRLMNVRKAFIEYYKSLDADGKKKLNDALEAGDLKGKNLDKLSYILFGSRVAVNSDNSFDKLIDQHDNVDDLIAAATKEDSKTDLKELVTFIMSDTGFQQALNNINANEFGITDDKSKTFLDVIMDIIEDIVKSIVGDGFTVKDGSLLREAISATANLIKENGGFAQKKLDMLQQKYGGKETTTETTKETPKIIGAFTIDPSQLTDKELDVLELNPSVKGGGKIKAIIKDTGVEYSFVDSGAVIMANAQKADTALLTKIGLKQKGLGKKKQPTPPVEETKEELNDLEKQFIEEGIENLNAILNVPDVNKLKSEVKAISKKYNIDEISLLGYLEIYYDGSENPIPLSQLTEGNNINDVLIANGEEGLDSVDESPRFRTITQDIASVIGRNTKQFTNDINYMFEELEGFTADQMKNVLLPFLSNNEYIELMGKVKSLELFNQLKEGFNDNDYNTALNTLAELFNEYRNDQKIDNYVEKLFKKIEDFHNKEVKTGNLENYFINNVDNKMSTSEDLLPVFNTKIEVDGLGLSQEDSKAIMDGLTSYLFSEFKDVDSDQFFADELDVSGIYSNIRKKLQRSFASSLSMLNKALVKNIDNLKKYEKLKKASLVKATQEKIQKITEKRNEYARIKNAFFMKSKGDEQWNQLVIRHADRMSSYGIKIDTDSLLEELESSGDYAFNRNTGDINHKLDMPPAVKLWVASRSKKRWVDGEYRTETNKFQFPVLHDFDEMYNYIARISANLPADANIMFDKLSETYEKEFKYNKSSDKASTLAELVGKDSIFNLGRSNTATLNDVKLLHQIVQTFSKQTPEFFLVTAMEDGKYVHYNANSKKTSDKVFRTWKQNYVDRLTDTTRGKVLKLSDAKIILNLLTNGIDTKEGLKRLGIVFGDFKRANEAIKLITGKDDIASYVNAKNALADHLKKAIDKATEEGKTDLGRYMPFEDADLSSLKLFATAEASTSYEVLDNQLINADGKTVYGITMNHYMSLLLNEINYFSGNEEALRERLPHLFNAYNKNSLVRSMMVDSNNPVKIQTSILNGFSYGTLGETIKDISEPNRWTMMLNTTLADHPVYTFYRSADRTVENGLRFINKKADTPIKLFDGVEDVKKQMLGYLIDEMNVIYQLRKNNLGSNIKFYNKNGLNLRFFSGDEENDNVLVYNKHQKGEKDLSKEIAKIIDKAVKRKSSVDVGDLLLANTELTEKLVKSFKQFFERKAVGYYRADDGSIVEAKDEKTKKREQSNSLRTKLDSLALLTRIPIEYFQEKVWDAKKGKSVKVTKDREGRYFNGISSDIFDKYLYSMATDPKNPTEAELNLVVEQILVDFEAIQFGAYVEQTKILTGDPMMFKHEDDFFKRMKMYNSTKKVSIIDESFNELMNNRNGGDLYVDLMVEGKKVRQPLNIKVSNEEIKNGFTKKTTALINKTLNNSIIFKGKTIDNVQIQTDLGWRKDGKQWNNQIKTVILEDVKLSSLLAKDEVTDVAVEKGKLVFKDKNGKKTTPSTLTKLFAEEFYKDGITNPVRLTAKVLSYTKEYKGYDEADAQGYVTMDEYKEILMRSGDWTEKHDKAYSKIQLGKELTTDEIFLFPVLKTQYTGPLNIQDANNAGLDYGDSVNADSENDMLYVPSGYKHSIFPLIPQVVKGTKLEALLNMMEDNQIGIAQFASGNKYGVIVAEDGKSNTFYNEEGNIEYDNTGESPMFNGRPIIEQSIDYKYFGIQVDQAPKMKNRITVSSQFRKLILSNLVDQGIPIDAIEVVKSRIISRYADFDQESEMWQNARIKREWNNMTEQEKNDASPVYKIYSEYTAIQSELIKRPLNELIDELGVEPIVSKDAAGNDQITGYKIGNRQALVDVVIEASKDRSVPDNVIASINSLLDEQTYIEQILTKEKVEQILNALVNNRVIREKRRGEMSPQVASAGFESGLAVLKDGKLVDKAGKPIKYLNGKSVKGVNNLIPEALKTYRKGKNGKVLPAEVMISLPKEWNDWVNASKEEGGFGGLDGLNAELDKLFNKLGQIEEEGSQTYLSKNEEALLKLITLIGFRIPNQSLNSSDSLRVRRFLPTTSGNSVVVPSEMIPKAGSDFDIDKLSLYLANATKPRKRKDGKWELPKYVEYKNGKTANDINNRYFDYVSKNANKEDRKESKESVKEEFAEWFEELEQLKDDTSEKANERKQELRDGIAKAIENQEEVENIGFALFKSIPSKAVRGRYYNLNDDFNEAGDEGLKKQLNFLLETELMISQIQEALDNNQYIEVEYTDRDDKKQREVIDNPEAVIKRLKKLKEYYEGQIGFIKGEETTNQYAIKLKQAAEKVKEAKQKRKDLDMSEIWSEYNEEYSEAIAGLKLVSMETAARKSGLMSLEDFSAQSIIEQNTKEALENRMLELHGDIMALESNFRQIMAPISDAILNDENIGTVWDVRFLESNSDEMRFLLNMRENLLQGYMSEENNIFGYITKGSIVETKDIPKDMVNEVLLTKEAMDRFTDEMYVLYLEARKQWVMKDKEARDSKPIAVIASPTVNMNKFKYFLSGKAGVGQTAVHVTHHQLAAAVDLHLTTDNPYWVFDHNKTFVGDDLKPSFSGIKDTEGEVISETLSAYLNAYVDIAADPYIYDLNAGNSTANTILMLVRAGAPAAWIARFMKQPIIMEYVQRQSANESIPNKLYKLELSKRELVNLIDPLDRKKILLPRISESMQDIDGTIDRMYKDYLDAPDGSVLKEELRQEMINYKDGELVKVALEAASKTWDEYKKALDGTLFSTEKMMDYIAYSKFKEAGEQIPNELSYLSDDNEANFNQIQSMLLDLFLEYQRQSKHLQELIRATSPDTKGLGKSRDAILNQLNILEKVKAVGIFGNIDNLIDDTIVKEFQRTIEESEKMYKPLYLVEAIPTLKNTKTVLYNKFEGFQSGAERKIRLNDIIVNDMIAAMLTVDFKDGDTEFNTRRIYEELFVSRVEKEGSDIKFAREYQPKYIDRFGRPASLATIIGEIKSLSKTEINTASGNASIKLFAKLKDNALIKALTPQVGTDSMTYDDFISKDHVTIKKPKLDYIRLDTMKLTPNRSNDLTEAFELINEKHPELARDLIRHSIAQSGFNMTPFTFTKLIPNEHIHAILKDKINKFKNLPREVQQAYMYEFMKQFEQRNIRLNPGIKRVQRPVEYTVKKGHDKGKVKEFMAYSTTADNPVAKFSQLVAYKKVGDDFIKYARSRESYTYNDRDYVKYVKREGRVIGEESFFVGYDLSNQDIVDSYIKKAEKEANDQLEKLSDKDKEKVDNMTDEEIAFMINSGDPQFEMIQDVPGVISKERLDKVKALAEKLSEEIEKGEKDFDALERENYINKISEKLELSDKVAKGGVLPKQADDFIAIKRADGGLNFNFNTGLGVITLSERKAKGDKSQPGVFDFYINNLQLDTNQQLKQIDKVIEKVNNLTNNSFQRHGDSVLLEYSDSIDSNLINSKSHNGEDIRQIAEFEIKEAFKMESKSLWAFARQIYVNSSRTEFYQPTFAFVNFHDMRDNLPENKKLLEDRKKFTEIIESEDSTFEMKTQAKTRKENINLTLDFNFLKYLSKIGYANVLSELIPTNINLLSPDQNVADWYKNDLMTDATEVGNEVLNMLLLNKENMKKPIKITKPKVKDGKVNIWAGGKSKNLRENAHLSNFAERPFTVDGDELTSLLPTEDQSVTFKTVEGAFQAAKLIYYNGSDYAEYFTTQPDPLIPGSTIPVLTDKGVELLNEFANATGLEAKRKGRELDIDVTAWDEDSVYFMAMYARESFNQNEDAKASLMATGNLTLTHTQDKGKWGKLFPEILTDIREELFEIQSLSSLEFDKTITSEANALTQEQLNNKGKKCD